MGMMRGRELLAVICMCLFVVAGCGDDKATQPTPTPTPTPAPTPAPTPTPTPPPAPAALDSLAVDPASVEGQSSPTATVTLTAAAPAEGIVVSLQSGNPEVAKVPSSVTVASGATTATFKVDTSTVPTERGVTIQATYSGVTKAVVLTVRPPQLIARFSVSSPSRGSGACEISNAGGAVDCRLDATSSGGFVSRYVWLLTVGTHESSFPNGENVYVPTTDCSHLTGGTPDSNGAIGLSIKLVVEDRQGNTSTSNSQSVNLYTRGFCGY
jgi:hypothetical protein